MFSTYIIYCRGYKIKLFLTTSNIDSIENIYNEYNMSIIINCHFKVIFAINDFYIYMLRSRKEYGMNFMQTNL